MSNKKPGRLTAQLWRDGVLIAAVNHYTYSAIVTPHLNEIESKCIKEIKDWLTGLSYGGVFGDEIRVEREMGYASLQLEIWGRDPVEAEQPARECNFDQFINEVVKQVVKVMHDIFNNE